MKENYLQGATGSAKWGLDNITHYKTEKCRLLGLMNSATKFRFRRDLGRVLIGL